MDSTYSVTQAQTNLPRLIKEATEEGSIAITRHAETVAYLISRGRMDAIMETLELLGNPAAMKALRDYEEGKTRFLPLAALNGDKGRAFGTGRPLRCAAGSSAATVPYGGAPRACERTPRHSCSRRPIAVIAPA